MTGGSGGRAGGAGSLGARLELGLWLTGPGTTLVEALTDGGLTVPSTISTVPQRLQVILTRLPMSFSSATP